MAVLDAAALNAGQALPHSHGDLTWFVVIDLEVDVVAQDLAYRSNDCGGTCGESFSHRAGFDIITPFLCGDAALFDLKAHVLGDLQQRITRDSSQQGP